MGAFIPVEEVARAFRKHGWEVTIDEDKIVFTKDGRSGWHRYTTDGGCKKEDRRINCPCYPTINPPQPGDTWAQERFDIYEELELIQKEANPHFTPGRRGFDGPIC
ncbi:MAG: hypothetical protein WCW16_01540 [Candidatus Magasanikbacteria bacterium]